MRLTQHANEASPTNGHHPPTGHVSPQYRDQHLKPLVDLFCLSEACLVAGACVRRSIVNRLCVGVAGHNGGGLTDSQP